MSLIQKIIVFPGKKGLFFDTEICSKIATFKDEVEGKDKYEIEIEGEKPIYLDEKDIDIFLNCKACEITEINYKTRHSRIREIFGVQRPPIDYSTAIKMHF